MSCALVPIMTATESDDFRVVSSHHASHSGNSDRHSELQQQQQQQQQRQQYADTDELYEVPHHHDDNNSEDDDATTPTAPLRLTTQSNASSSERGYDGSSSGQSAVCASRTTATTTAPSTTDTTSPLAVTQTTATDTNTSGTAHAADATTTTTATTMTTATTATTATMTTAATATVVADDGECASVDPAFEAMERDARVVLERIAMRDPDTELRMAEYVAVLQRYRGACQERAMYKEAHLLQQVLRNLRLEEETRHVRGLTEQQMEERRALEQAHRDAFRRFHHEWNGRINDFEEQQLAHEEALFERQGRELAAFQEEMRAYAPRVLRYSRALLHTRAKQVTLARQREYVRANTEKRRGDALAAHDAERYGDVRTSMYARREAALQQRHAQELHALRMRIEGRRLYLERQRKHELEVMLQHYLNVRRELANQQNIVRSKTGAVLLKYACNTKADTSASAMLVESAASGTFGTTVQRRLIEEVRALRASRRGEPTATTDGDDAATAVVASSGSGEVGDNDTRALAHAQESRSNNSNSSGDGGAALSARNAAASDAGRGAAAAAAADDEAATAATAPTAMTATIAPRPRHGNKATHSVRSDLREL